MSSENTPSNIKPFPKKAENPNSTAITTRTTEAVIYSLFEIPPAKIYYERDNHPTSSTPQFFEILIASGQAKLYYRGDMIDYSRISVGEDDNTYEITASEFVTMTAIDPHRIEDTDAHIETWLDRNGIKIGMRQDEEMEDIRHLSEADRETYRVENIIGYGDGYYYHAELYDEDDMSLGDSVGYEIDSLEDVQEPTLLDIILVALSEAQYRDYKGTQSKMIITYFEHESASTIMTHLSEDMMRKIIHDALTRLHPLYQNMSLEHAIEHYISRK